MGGVKDWLLDKTLPSILNQRFRDLYGEITGLKLDSHNKTLQLELTLRGEQEKLWIQIHRYELVQENGQTQFVIREISISREWLGALAQEFVLNRPFPLPPEIAKIVSLLA